MLGDYLERRSSTNQFVGDLGVVFRLAGILVVLCN